MHFNNKGVLAILACVLLGALLTPFIKLAVRDIPPETFTFFRFLTAFIVLIPFILRAKIKVDKNLPQLILASIFGTANVLIFAYGVKLTSASVSQALYLLAPVVVAVISYFLLNERLKLKEVLGIGIGLGGASLIVALPLIQKDNAFSGSILGNILVFLAVVSFGFYSVLSKRLQNKFSPIQSTTVYSITTTLLAFIPMSLSGDISNIHFSKIAIIAVLYVGILGTALYYFLYQYGIAHIKPTTASAALLYLQPIGVVIASHFLLNETPTLGFFVGSAIAAIGTWIVLKS